MKMQYLIEITTMRDQRIRERTPSTVSGVRLSRLAARGLLERVKGAGHQHLHGMLRSVACRRYDRPAQDDVS